MGLDCANDIEMCNDLHVWFYLANSTGFYEAVPMISLKTDACLHLFVMLFCGRRGREEKYFWFLENKKISLIKEDIGLIKEDIGMITDDIGMIKDDN